MEILNRDFEGMRSFFRTFNCIQKKIIEMDMNIDFTEMIYNNPFKRHVAKQILSYV